MDNSKKLSDLEGIGHLARIHGKINHKNVLTALTSVMDNAELSGRAEDAMSDIDMFVKK